jgi:hypothetical protein
MAKEKSRYFTLLLYPESIPTDWEMKLESLGIRMAVSPLHDMDVKKDPKKYEPDDVIRDGVHYKKPHYHVIYVAKNPVTADSVRYKVRKVLGDKSLSHVQIVVEGMENVYAYLTHESKSAKEAKKHVYDKKDIKLINNFDIDRYISLDVADKDDLLNLVCEIIAEHGLANILELKRFVDSRGAEFGLPSMAMVHSVLRSHTGLVRLYLDGAYQERKYAKKINPETGEIL